MESTQLKKLGAGIVTISAIQLIGAIFSVLGSLLLFSSKSEILNEMQTSKQNIASNTQITITLILQVLLAITIILILLKKSIGIYSYFTVVTINILYSIISIGFQWTIIFSLILPVLMAIFIYKKKSLFTF
ncbi:hypothetical protein [Clostridium beijerinckii]|uniref:Uncharacterized protein cfg01 n=2 Tax=Clostridium beijerinckii TaxID=1520 RepID=Q7WYU2_CLOBE|nr:hypothetical protein [Clostridium beijerinckii]NRZ29507.1 hypothetical protein [Clostridium beijerinckii]NYC00009.1 hypothetical protein [Clostridium beijerinckii]OOM22384.1 hypothetical protein CLBEI_33070 [Clostridium beijerinckii]QUN37922.1 hypothetical protein KEC93_26230 [Clostridium beijerinckii]CAD97579.1 hypothetical protein [Clostridium beijerinckii]